MKIVQLRWAVPKMSFVQSIQVAILRISISEIKRTGCRASIFACLFQRSKMALAKFFRAFDLSKRHLFYLNFRLLNIVSYCSGLLFFDINVKTSFPAFTFETKYNFRSPLSRYVPIFHRIIQNSICLLSYHRRSERKIDRFPSWTPEKSRALSHGSI